MKYSAKLHTKPNNLEKVKYIGIVEADSFRQLKKNAKQHARNWNHYGRVHILCENINREFVINAI